ncbi:2-dehydro-3-deoxyphosphooctonate aldolase [Flavobacterium sp.]|uniref:2-dehydro-3-deoxyphosphooctonate aldolase n=1 Tax=Flavobacterium sp. TaxID=239 RepID=UPI00286C0AF1|nr:2-dehydro-3-deoxyphosphooctonate aldolase [Flavobacterium sp.]
MKKILISISIILMLTSCISTKSTIQNIDDATPTPEINQALGSFVVTKIAKDKKYGYNPDYPVNVGFTSIDEGLNNQIRFLNALAGPNGEKIKFEKKDACCPFPTKKTDMGAGTIDIFEISWTGLPKPILLYINRFEKGELMIPLGFSIRK